MAKRLSELAKSIQVKIKLAQIKAAKEVAQLIPELIKIRTRLEGEGVDGPLKELSDSYIKQRKGELSFFTTGEGDNKRVVPYKPNKKPKLHPDTSPETSNLTATGQLLDSIQGRNVGTKVIVEPKKGKRKGELSGGKSKLSNREVLKYVEENGRKFHELSKEERLELLDLIEQIIKDEIRSVIK
jgi:hypothetical protein